MSDWMLNWPNWAWLLVRFACGAAICAFITWVGWKLGQFPWAMTFGLFSIPLFAFAVAKPLIEFSHEGIDWLAAGHSRIWHGAYYKFNDVQIRVYEDDDKLWFTVADVLKACGIRAVPDAFLASYPANCKLLGRHACLDIEGVEKLFERHGNTDLGRLMVWAKREVVAPWERKKMGAVIPR